MNLDKGQGSLPSKMGAINSFFLLIVLLIYTYYKFDIMLEKKDVDILSAVQRDHFQADYEFKADRGLNVALAVFDPFDPSSYK